MIKFIAALPIVFIFSCKSEPAPVPVHPIPEVKVLDSEVIITYVNAQ